MNKIEIELVGGRYLVNGKPFNELSHREKIFLNDFFKELKENHMDTISGTDTIT